MGRPTRGSRQLRHFRESAVGAFYFVTFTSLNRQPFTDLNTVFSQVLSTFQHLDLNDRISGIVLVAMPDHFHAVFELREGSLAQVMHTLKGYSAWKINRCLGRRGSLWDSGYFERELRTEPALEAVVEYCQANPLEKGLVEDFEDWPHFWAMWQE
jgi:REP-associated tyrosine transposase